MLQNKVVRILEDCLTFKNTNLSYFIMLKILNVYKFRAYELGIFVHQCLNRY